MASQISTHHITELTGLPASASCARECFCLSGTGLSCAPAARPRTGVVRETGARAERASAVAAAKAGAYVSPRGAFRRGTAANRAAEAMGAAGSRFSGQQRTQLHPMWAFRGLDPWSDPA